VIRFKAGTAAWWTARTRFDAETGCVRWTGFVCKDGYARTWWRGKGGVLIHRIAYEQVHGPFNASLKVCHSCDTPNCVNPAHLFLGTQKDNLRDMFAKGRAKPRGKATAPLTAFPTVSYRVLRSAARKKLDNTVESIDLLHLIGTSAMVAPWRQVTGVPARRPTQALVVWTRPRQWTFDAEVTGSVRVSDQCTAGATAAPLCAGSPGARAL